ncbi:hypothetical protein DD563_10055 [Pelagicola sp. LXJ1103]|nr:hypothetical protein DD563_10055 [Pelagicola sp. LXJ1103]
MKLGLVRSLMSKFAQVRRDAGLAVALARAGGYLHRRIAGGPGDLVPVGATDSTAYLGPVWRDLAQRGAFHIHTKHSQDRPKIALIGDLNLPQCRKYRVEQLAELWAGLGVDLSFAHYQDLPRATGILQDATHLICYRVSACPELSMHLYEARRLRLPVLYDIDDPLFSVSAYETYGNMTCLDPALRTHFVTEAPRYLDAMNAADIISVSTPGLADHARLLTDRPVFVRRNFADTTTLKLGAGARDAARADGFRIVFASGSQGHEADFATIAEEVAEFLHAAPDRRLIILGHFDLATLPAGVRARCEKRPFTGYDEYLNALAEADCAVMPLADDTFNHCKSAVRAIDAAAVSVPAIASDVGDFPNVITHGRTGLIAGQGMWHAALERLTADSIATRAMGHAARRDLEARWSASRAPQIIAPELVDWVLG